MGFGFNVSKQRGWQLKQMLDAGERVVLHARVEAEYYDGRIEIATASFPGELEPEKEVLIIGHLCHPSPSANDNASGSGGMLEMARALKKMVDSGRIPPPRRTIRFLWVPEFYGTVPYIQAHLERTRNTLSVINCDMIGEDLHLTGGLFTITCTPHSLPSYLNDVAVNFARMVQSQGLQSLNGSRHPFAFLVNPYSGGSDHVVFNDGALRVPALMFGHGDTFHHTSLDTPDKVDASELRRVCAIALGTSAYLAQASDSEAVAMARLVTRNGLGRLAADAYDALETVFDADSPASLHDAFDRALNGLVHAARREVEAILSTEVFLSDPANLDSIRAQAAQIEALEGSLKKELQAGYRELCVRLGTRPREAVPASAEAEPESWIPVRSEDFVCPLQTGYINDRLGPGALEGLKLGGNAAYEALNFVDGERSVYAISRAVSAEYGPISAREVLAFFKILERCDLLRLVRR